MFNDLNIRYAQNAADTFLYFNLYACHFIIFWSIFPGAVNVHFNRWQSFTQNPNIQNKYTHSFYRQTPIRSLDFFFFGQFAIFTLLQIKNASISKWFWQAQSKMYAIPLSSMRKQTWKHSTFSYILNTKHTTHHECVSLLFILFLFSCI